ncbi:MAG: FMN-binding protein [Chloroflexi bacterium]|nr:FMN-binding protein [Chloroflexota bacterium]
MPILPRRALIAIATTAVALALVLSFRTPDMTITRSSGLAIVGPASPAPTAGGQTAPNPAPAAGGAAAGSGGSGGGASGTVSSAPTTPAPAAPGAGATGQFTGPVITTRFGDTEVQMTLAKGRITDVQAVVLPSDGRSGFISQTVAPILQSEALQAQSAQIDIVSGATYTSDAYAQSLQGALDQAHG